MLKPYEAGPQAYRDAMAKYAGATQVITTDGLAGKRGTTIIAACSVSDSPPMVLACLNRENPNNELFVRNGVFALNTLSGAHRELAQAFSGVTKVPPAERFSYGVWDTMATGAPTLTDALAVFDCELIDTKDMATHRVLFGKVTGLRHGDSLDPLLYFNRGYHVL